MQSIFGFQACSRTSLVARLKKVEGGVDTILKEFPDYRPKPPAPEDESNVFLRSEGDAFFIRNGNAEKPPDDIGQDSAVVGFILGVLKNYLPQIQKVLEVGSSDGRTLEALCDCLGAEGVGIDPSALAVATGNERLQKARKPVELFRGLASNLEFDSQSFDFVLLGFFLYIERRESLLYALAEADRVLRPGGFVAVIDFNPGVAIARDYSHLAGQKTFKNYYPAFFTALSHYVEVAKLPLNSSLEINFDFDPQNRHELTILWKKPDPYPQAL